MQKPTQKKLTPERLKELAQACQNLLLSTDEGQEKLSKLTHSLANLNKQYHRDKEAWEHSWVTLNRLAERDKQAYAKFRAWQEPCNRETELRMAMAGRSLTPWKKVRSPLESVMQYEQRMRDRDYEERKRWGKDIPECIEADRIYNTEVAPSRAALKEPEDAYYTMAQQYEQTRKRYDALYEHYKSIMLDHFWWPAEKIRSFEPYIVDGFETVRPQFPKMEDHFSSETLFGYLIKIQNAKTKADILCRERLAPPPPPQPDPREQQAEEPSGNAISTRRRR